MNTELEARQRAHIMYTWSAQSRATPLPIAGGKGATFTDHEGNRWLDFESQVFNCNAGHGETRIIRAMQAQLESLACAHPAAVYEAKAALGERLASVTPEGIDRFFLCLSGAEANENAIKIARAVTGRTKVVARRRSYHGASMGALSLTGDPRRLAGEPGLWGVVRIEDPYCFRCPFETTPDRCGVLCARHLEHVVQLEGPETIAAVFLEGITGANGGFVPPADYWPTMRKICDKYGILLVADEVFTGFGRTGRYFAVDHFGVTPDLITLAKGLTSGYAPLGAVGMTERVAEHFDTSTLQCGLTGYAMPVSVAAAVATLDVYREDRLVERAAERGQELAAGLWRLKARHPAIGDARSLGLFGTIELVTPDGRPLVAYDTVAPKDSPAGRLKEALVRRRVHAAFRWSFLMIAPPLCITSEELAEGLDHLDAALTEVGL